MEKIKVFWRRFKSWLEYIFGFEQSLTISDLDIRELLGRVVHAMRMKAHNIPEFRDSHNGCIRITVVPLCNKAEAWLNGEDRDFMRYLPDDMAPSDRILEFVYKIDPDGSYTKWIKHEFGSMPISCYGYAALETAFSLWQAEMRNSSGEPYMGHFVEENGWSMWPGSTYMIISLNGTEFLRLHIATFGSDHEGDLQCSQAGALAAQLYFDLLGDVVTCTPNIKETFFSNDTAL